MAYWRTVAVDQSDQNESDSKLKKIEDSEGAYKCAMQDDWEGVKQYYQNKPDELLIPMTVDKDTAFHLAASCCSKSQVRRVLEMLISLLSSTSYGPRCALRKPNNTGNNTLHDVSLSGSVDAAEYLVSNFNEPVELEGEVIISSSASGNEDKENDVLPLLETRNDLGETPLFRAAALGHTDLVNFYSRKLKENNPDNLFRHFYRNDKLSILHVAVIEQRFGLFGSL
ncbi:uncharacterized protein LOC125480390 [Pyrus x bretschneideri]|uniref:uncharacterized protein LOC125480390 n=1 Tax=Pyrus x bretschneideri TaxID=225117 RepID=UPI002030F312|nr:uncharacterized protein LOC125480390 [Pyrus x bretschneideri]